MPPGAYTAKELHQFLVIDAVNQHATDLRWFVLALRRIAELDFHGHDDGTSVEAAYLRVEQEVITLTGHGMPVYSGPVT